MVPPVGNYELSSLINRREAAVFLLMRRRELTVARRFDALCFEILRLLARPAWGRPSVGGCSQSEGSGAM